MWISRARQDIETIIAAAPESSQMALRRHRKMGTMVHVPVLNSCETVVKMITMRARPSVTTAAT
eukprot:4973153-Pyramimonas_sp.AAC.1